jgi:cell division septum initiation protein DivIVA
MIDLAEKYAEIERRIKKLVDDNRSHKKRIRELEKELNQTRNMAQKSVKVRDNQARIRDRIEKILKDLEGVEVRKD